MSNKTTPIANFSKKLLKSSFFIVSLLLILLFSIFIIFELLYWDKIFPAVSIAQIDVSGLTPEQAKSKVSRLLQTRLNSAPSYSSPDQANRYQLSIDQVNLNLATAIQSAYALG